MRTKIIFINHTNDMEETILHLDGRLPERGELVTFGNIKYNVLSVCSNLHTQGNLTRVRDVTIHIEEA